MLNYNIDILFQGDDHSIENQPVNPLRQYAKEIYIHKREGFSSTGLRRRIYEQEKAREERT